MIEILETRIAPAALIFADNDASGYVTAAPVDSDAFGNIVVAGVFDESITLNGGGVSLTLSTASGTGSDIYVAKYSPDGMLLWATSWGGVPKGGATGPEEVLADVVVVGDAFIYALASFSTMNAGFGGIGTAVAAGPSFNDTVIFKLDFATGAPDLSFGAGGMTVWGGDGEDTGVALAASGGDVYFAGTYASGNPTVNGVTGFPPASGDDIYAIKLNADGNPVTTFGTQGVVNFGTPGPDRVLDLVATQGTGDFMLAASSSGFSYVRSFRGVDGSPNFAFGGSGTGRLDIPNLGAIALDNAGRLLATGGIANPGGYLRRFDFNSGAPDVTLDGDGVVDFGTSAQFGSSIVVDDFDNIFVGGFRGLSASSPSPYFIAKFRDNGAADPNFGSSGRLTWALSGNDNHRSLNLAVDAAGYVTARGFFSNTTDIDPTKGVFTAVAHAVPPTVPHPNLDTFLVRLDPNGVDAANSFKFTDADGDTVRFSFKGSGRLSVIPGTTPGVDIERIEAFDTDATTKLSISLGKGAFGTTIAHIVTPGVNQHVGIVKLASNITLGDGLPGSPALEITGSVQKVTLGNVAPNATIKLGNDLPYDDPDPLVPDTFNMRPQLSLKDVGVGVTIDVTGDGTVAGVGGGGLGKILVSNWNGAGLIKTTQSVLAYKQKTGDCFVVFELDKFGVGASTRADMGSISIPNGAWGSSGSEIEGYCGSFSCASFLAGATISVGNINVFKVNSGPYAGTTTLTNPSAPGMGTFKVNSDYAGIVLSMSSIRNITVNGVFKGSLVAASIGSITAFSYDGTTADDGGIFGDSTRHNIIAQSGSLGLLKTKAGGIKNYEVEVLTKFAGYSIASGAGGPFIGIENVKTAAAEIARSPSR
jgi:hypothetical protein